MLMKMQGKNNGLGTRGIYTYAWCMFQNGNNIKKKKALANYITTNLLNGIFITFNFYTFSSKFQWQNMAYDSFTTIYNDYLLF